MSEASMFVWTCTSRHARWTSLIIQWSPDSTDCFNKRQLSSRVARRTLLSTQTHNVCAVRIYTVLHIINKWITKMCVLVTRLCCLAHNPDQSLYQHQAVGAPLLVRNWQLQSF